MVYRNYIDKSSYFSEAITKRYNLDASSAWRSGKNIQVSDAIKSQEKNDVSSSKIIWSIKRDR